MRVLVDLASHVAALKGSGDPLIMQVEKDYNLGESAAINGKYVIPVPEGTDVSVDASTQVLPIDGDDLASQTYAELLSRFPQYGNIYFNPLMTQANLAEIDETAAFTDYDFVPPRTYPSRFQSGRAVPPDSGIAPNSTALLPVNDTGATPKPGMMITDLIDLTPYTAGVGADSFMVYWMVYEFETTDDIAGGAFGLTAGTNEPAIRSIVEVDQEPSDLQVYISIDDGANWLQVGRLEPISFCCKATEIRLAFRNNGNSKLYVSTFGLMF